MDTISRRNGEERESGDRRVPGLTRRSFLGVGAGALAGATLAPLVAACASEPTTGSAGATAALPSYVPAKIPKPDEPGNAQGVSNGYWHYPSQLIQSVHGTPGRGGTVTAFLITYTPPPTPLNQNTFWQDLNRRLGVNFQPSIAASSDYPDKLSALMASNQYPDYMLLTGAVPNEFAFLEAKCQDLTEFLSGDAVRAYPNLANIPTHAWRNCMFEGRIFGLPQDRGVMANGIFIHQNLFDQVGTSQPRDLADFTRLMKDLTRPKQNQWALGAPAGTIYDSQLFYEVFGAPNVWSVDHQGRFTADIETEAAKEAVAYMRQLKQAGVFYPDANITNTVQCKDLFASGSFAAYLDGFSYYLGAWTTQATVDPKLNVGVLAPFGRNGGKGRYFLGAGSFGVTAMKKAPKGRIQELLRIANYMAAPFGTTEWMFMVNGVKDVDYTLVDGTPVQTARGKQEMLLPFGYIVGGPVTYVSPQYPDYVKAVHAAQEEMVPLGVPNPAVGLYSNTYAEKGSTLLTLVDDRISAIVDGRSPMSDWGDFVRTWRTQGGDQMRREYEQEYEKSKKK